MNVDRTRKRDKKNWTTKGLLKSGGLKGMGPDILAITVVDKQSDMT